MNAEDQRLKQIPSLTKEEKRRKLMTATVLALATLLAVLFFAYAFMQKLEADKNAELAIQLKIEADQMRDEAERQRIVAAFEKNQAVESARKLNSQLQLTLEELEKCKKNK